MNIYLHQYRRRVRNILLAVVVVAASATGFVAAEVVNSVDLSLDSRLFLPLGMAALCLFVGGRYLVEKDYFSSLNVALLFFGVAFGLRPAWDIFVNYQGVADHPQLVPALVAMWLGSASFMVGYLSPAGKRLASRYPVFRSEWDGSRVLLVIVFYTAVSVLTYFVFTGGRIYLPDFYAGRFEAQRGKGYFLWGVRSIAISALVYYCHYLRLRRKRIAQRVAVGLYILFALGILSSTGMREFALFLAVSLLVCRHYLHSKVSLVAIALLAGAGMAFLVEYELFRLYTGGVIPFWRVVTPLHELGLFVERFTREFSFTRTIADVIRIWPHTRPFELGTTYFSTLLMPIPRVLWPDKPAGGVGSLINQVLLPNSIAGRLGYYGFGYSPSMLGEAYLNLGWFGIVPVFSILGVLARSAYVYIRRNGKSPSAVLLYAVCLWSVLMELRGGFAATTTTWLTNMAAAIVALHFIAGRDVS